MFQFFSAGGWRAQLRCKLTENVVRGRRTKGELNVLGLQDFAPPMQCKLARERSEVLDKVVGHILENLQSMDTWTQWVGAFCCNS